MRIWCSRSLWPLCVVLLLCTTFLPASLPTHAAAALPASNPLITQSGILVARVAQSGLVTIPATALSANGWLTDQIPAANVHVWTGGTEIPIAVTGSTNGVLTGATLRFIGHANTSRYTRETVYWLSHDSAVGLRAPVALAPGDPLRWDEERVYNSLFAGPTGDRWFGREVLPSHTVTATLTLPSSVPAGTRLQLGLIGEEMRNHTLTVAANGAKVGTLTWQDVESATVHRPQAQMLALTLPTALPAGTVRFDLTLTSQGLPSDAALIDSVELPTVRPAYSADAVCRRANRHHLYPSVFGRC